MRFGNKVVAFAGSDGRRIFLAYATSLLSKLATAACQICALPLAAHSLGDVRFGFLMFLGAATSFLTLPAQGLSSTISYGIAGASGDRQSEQYEFWSTVLLGFILSVVIGLFIFALLVFVNPEILLGNAVRDVDRKDGFSAVLIYIVAFCLFSWADGFRAGYKENYVTNLFSTGAAILIIVGAGVCAYLSLPFFYFFCAVFLTPMLAQALNMLLLLRGRSYLLRGPRFSADVFRAVLVRVTNYSTAQLGAVLKMHGTTILVGRIAGFELSAVIGTLFRVVILCYSALLGLLLPIIPTLTTAVVKKDNEWLRKGGRFCLLTCLGGGLLIGLSISLFGHSALKEGFALSSGDEDYIYSAIGLASYFFISSSGCFLIMFALGMGGWTSRQVLIEGLLITAATILFLNFFSVSVTIFLQAGISMLITGVRLPLMLIKVTTKGHQHSST